jgi:sigma-E factor negative regulatory protein RseC
MTKDKLMYKEELTEEGIVKASKDGIAEIIISDSNHCEECSAKIYCKPGNEKFRTLLAKDPFNSESGDKVVVSIKGSRIMLVSFLIYGLPLLLMIFGLILGYRIFEHNKEILSTILAFGLIVIYALIFLLVDKKSHHNFKGYPEIVFVLTKQD